MAAMRMTAVAVIRKREDGYHDLETLFVPYHDISDTLEIIRAEDYSVTLPHLQAQYGAAGTVQSVQEDAKVMITIARNEGVDWDPLEDLTVRAYRLLDADFSLGPVKIFLEKKAPVGAGLGGGSSDAAFALRMISEIFGLGLGIRELSDYAARLGSDCSFFLHDRPMFGSGRGEASSDPPGFLFGPLAAERRSDDRGRRGSFCRNRAGENAFRICEKNQPAGDGFKRGKAGRSGKTGCISPLFCG